MIANREPVGAWPEGGLSFRLRQLKLAVSPTRPVRSLWKYHDPRGGNPSDGKGTIQLARIVFCPHHFLELKAEGGKVTFALGATHHGFKADASTVPSELEKFCDEIRRARPGTRID